MAAIVDGVLATGWRGVTNATFTLANNTNEQDALEVTGITRPTDVAVTLNLKNLTQDNTIRVYEKVWNGAALEYQETDKKAWVVATDGDGVRLSFRAQADYKVTLKAGTAEGATRDVYIRHNRREMA